MGPWRLELVRIWRTQRWIALGAIFLLLGIADPVAARYLPELAKVGGHGPQITVATPTPGQGVSMFVNSLSQIGTLVVVVVAAASLSVDARPSLSAFYRTRLRRPVLLLLPRYLTTTVASLVALAVGTLGAWYETTVLLGAVPFGKLMLGLALEALWFCFVTSLVALFTGTIRGIAGVVCASIAALLALVAAGSVFRGVSSWLPTKLVGTAANIVQQPVGNVWHAVIVSAVAAVAAVSLGINRLGRRELYASGARRVKTGSVAKPEARSQASASSS
jgi:ABC-2 type transport system permease protein